MPESQESEEALDETNTDDKKKLKAVKRNNSAMANLTLAFSTNELINKIISAQNEECPEGLACIVVK